MSIYRFSTSRTVGDITFRTTENGSVRAYISAPDGADGHDIAEALSAMRAKDYTCTPFMLDGKPMLEVRGFGKEQALLDTLKPWVSEKPEITLEEADKMSWMDKFRKRTLQLSGISYIVGDVGFFTYGYKEADRLVMAASVAYFLGTLSLVFYGRNDQSDLQIRELSKELESFLCREDVPLPKDSALHHAVEQKEQTTLQNLNAFGKRYPSEIFNTVTAIAGLFIAASSYKKLHMTHPPGTDAKAIREAYQEAAMDLGLGVITALSGTFGTLVKEKKPDPDAPPKKGMEWLWQKIQAHPLAIAGGGYSIATLCHAGSTYKAYKEAKRVNDVERLTSVPRRALFVVAALTSEFLLAISSKGHGEGVVSDDSVDKTTIAIAADFIARQPLEKQQELIDGTVQFLGDAKHLAIKNDAMAAALREQVAAMNNNPWAATPAKIQPLPADNKVIQASKPAAHWQDRLGQSPAANAQLGA